MRSPSIAAAVEARPTPEIAIARHCYDHLAGRLGVALFRSLVARGAILDVRARAAARKVRSGLGEIALGPAAEDVFGTLAIDLSDVAAKRRQFATACDDWTESQPHLGGALGAMLYTRMLCDRWLLGGAGTRALRITSTGADGLYASFGIDVRDLTAGRAT